MQNVNASGLWAGLSSSHIVQGRLTVASLWQTPSSPPAGLSWAQLRGVAPQTLAAMAASMAQTGQASPSSLWNTEELAAR